MAWLPYAHMAHFPGNLSLYHGEVMISTLCASGDTDAAASGYGLPGHRYWMVPLLGVQAGGVSLPVTARGAILDSSSAFSLVTDKDFLIFEVSSQAWVA